MRIPILQFEVQETRIWTENLPLLKQMARFLFGPSLDVCYHFDVVMKVDQVYKEWARELEKGDGIQLPNGVQLKVWSVDRFGIVKAKTEKPVRNDLRGCLPIEIYLVYPRVHGHITDRAV
jgi:hypothetical protein